jgi:hypothetical protein
VVPLLAIAGADADLIVAHVDRARARLPDMSVGHFAVSRELVAKGQGAFNVAGGMWPLLSMRSFEAVYGPKVDKWLERTVAGLLVTIGVAQLLSRTDAELETARRLGIGTAATLAAIDLIYVPKGRISPAYLQDLLCEAGWLAAWTLLESD